MPKYYRIIAHTPYCGEDNEYYYADKENNYDKVINFASACVDDNANEWYTSNDENYPEWEDFLGDCYCVIEEITRTEYIINGGSLND